MNNYKKEDLERLILKEKKSYLTIGKLYNVSDNAIKKAAKKFGIPLPRKRKINEKENFSHPKKNKQSYVYKVSEEVFLNAIKTSFSWCELAEKLGYKSEKKNYLTKKIKKDILERSSKLGMELSLKQEKSLSEMTKKEIFSKNKNWQSARSTIRRNAQQIYLKNNKEPKCIVCGYSKHVEVAHKKPVSAFNDEATISEINSISNLMGLCPNHHWEYDNGVLEI